MKKFSFDKQTKVSNIQLEVLSESIQLKNAGTNNPGPTRPLQSWELIAAIQGMLDKTGIKYTPEPIWVEKRNSKRILTSNEEKEFNEKNTPANKWLFDNVVTQFNMPGTKDLNPSIGMSFNKKGIQVVWGTNVMVCSNMCVFGDNVISTYGAQRTPFGKQMQLLEYWISKMDAMFADDVKIIDDMKTVPVSSERLSQSIGSLYQKAIEKAYSPKAGLVAPINTSTLSIIVQDMLKAESQIDTVWDFYNVGTAVIKPGNFNLEDIIPTNKAWGDFLREEFVN